MSVTIRDLLTDPALLGHLFAGSTWATWRAVVCAAFGLALTDEEAATVRELTGRETVPERVRELWLLAGRRSGKSTIAAVIAIYAACFGRYRLSPGEIPVLAVIAPGKKQAAVVKGYLVGMLQSSRILAGMVRNETAEGVTLTNGVVVEITTADLVAPRSRTLVGAIVDEATFLPTGDSASPDTELLRALRPGLGTTGGMLVCAGSPYDRRGAAFAAEQKHFGREGSRVLVVKAPTLRLNATFDAQVVADAYEDDPLAAASEFGGSWRDDVEQYIDPAALDRVIIPGRGDLLPTPGAVHLAFVDPAGGSGSDSMTLAIAHTHNGVVVIDLLREVKPPFSPEATVNEFADTLRRFNVRTVVGDRYAGEWAREPFRQRGIDYRLAPAAKSDLYASCLPVVNSERVALPDNARLAAQLLGLERRRGRGGRDIIDHRPGSHDDLANVTAGAVLECVNRQSDPRCQPLTVIDLHTGLPKARHGSMPPWVWETGRVVWL